MLQGCSVRSAASTPGRLPHSTLTARARTESPPTASSTCTPAFPGMRHRQRQHYRSAALTSNSGPVFHVRLLPHRPPRYVCARWCTRRIATRGLRVVDTIRWGTLPESGVRSRGVPLGFGGRVSQSQLRPGRSLLPGLAAYTAAGRVQRSVAGARRPRGTVRCSDSQKAFHQGRLAATPSDPNMSRLEVTIR
jgi:hypothetical protein